MSNHPEGQLPYLSQKTVTRTLAAVVFAMMFLVGYLHIQWKNLEKRYAKLGSQYDTLLGQQQKK